jgi:hypothetical protein
MAPKRSAREQTPSSTATTQSSTTAAGPAPSIPSKASIKASSYQSPQEIALGIWQKYLDTTPQRTKLIDAFMSFLVVVGVLQFVYCVIAGNYVSYLDGLARGQLLIGNQTAVQCLPFWLFGDSGTVRFDWYVSQLL